VAVEVVGNGLAPGFSTAEAGHELSGRGVGLSAIKSAVDELGGSVSLHPLAAGSELRITLSATLLSGEAALLGRVAQKS
jgi:two-component system chemotaxis sensor kinase CheA